MINLKAAAKLLLIFVVSFVVVDIVAAILITILPSPGGRRLGGGPGFGSLLLYYVVWIIAGCFMGLFYTEGSRDATKKSELIERNPLIITAAGLLFALLSIILFFAVGQMNTFSYASSDSAYVPDNRYMTYAFFISMMLTSFLLVRISKPGNPDTGGTSGENQGKKRVQSRKQLK